ncbi:hypothetical protein M513_09229 [Trichuris suis]|uniref:Uncharacterized protein n=1 Tax=Trichuris suis TaxID=68888 RepID=A0A085LY54_9BILA|nr:hypothetical protein M513_09229 [Trichuris suis]
MNIDYFISVPRYTGRFWDGSHRLSNEMFFMYSEAFVYATSAGKETGCDLSVVKVTELTIINKEVVLGLIFVRDGEHSSCECASWACQRIFDNTSSLPWYKQLYIPLQFEHFLEHLLKEGKLSGLLHTIYPSLRLALFWLFKPTCRKQQKPSKKTSAKLSVSTVKKATL